MKNVRVVKTPDNPESTEILAAAITSISAGVTKLRESGLNEEAIIILIAAKATGVNRTQIKEVLAALRRLAGWYCK